VGRILKTTIGILITAIVVFLLAVFLFASQLNTDRFKTEAQQYFKTNTDSVLTIKGKVKLSYFPWMGVQLTQATLSNPHVKDPHPLLKIGKVEVNIKLLPLFAGRVEVRNVQLKDVILNIITSKSGQTNWHAFLQAREKQKAGKHQAGQFKPFRISKLILDNGNINWFDHNVEKQYSIGKLNLHSNQITPNQPFNLTIKCNVYNKNQDTIAKISVSTSAQLNQNAGQLLLNSLTISASLYDKQHLNNEILITGMSDSVIDLKSGGLNVKKLNIRSGDLYAKITLMARNLFSTPQMTGTLAIPTFNLKTYLSSLGFTVSTKDPLALTQFSIDSPITCRNNTFSLQKITANLDRTSITGNAHYQFDKKQLRFVLLTNKFSPEHYFPSKSAKKTSTRSRHQKSELIVDGKLRTGELIFNALTIKNVSAHAHYKNQRLSFSRITGELYSGRLTADASIHLDTPARYMLKGTLANAKLHEILQGNRHFHGNTTLQFNLISQGDITTLRGTTNIQINNGRIKGLNIKAQLQAITHYLTTKKETAETTQNTTPFAQLTADIFIAGGMAKNDNLVINAKHWHIKGKGTVNLVNKTLDYRVYLKILNSVPFVKIIPFAENLVNISLPLRITGAFDKPTVRPDFAELPKKLIPIDQLGKGLKSTINISKKAQKTLSKKLQSILK